MVEPFPRSHAAAARLRQLVPSGAHAYSKTANQWPARSPHMLTHGSGAWVWDLDGHRYVDWFPGLSSVPLGHAHPAVTTAVTAQLNRGTNFQLPTTIELEAAETFLETIARDPMVAFTKNASDAVNAALKLARHHTGRTHIAKCADHPFFSTGDWFIATTTAHGGTLPDAANHTLDFPYNDTTRLHALFTHHADHLAAVILEPVRFTPPDATFFTTLRHLCDHHGVVLIFDETVTGMKYHQHGARTLTGITPDLTIWGKGIANGLPLAALTGPTALMGHGDTNHPPADGRPPLLLLSTTHGGEATALAAMIATTHTFVTDNALTHSHTVGRTLRTRLAKVLADHDLTQHIRLIGYDCFIGTQFHDADGHPSAELKTLFLQELIRANILFRGIFYPTLAHTHEHIEATISAVRAAATVYHAALENGTATSLTGRAIPQLL